MTGVLIGDEINILSIKDGIATVEKKQAEVTHGGDDVDAGWTLGGDPASKVILQKPLAEILTRNEKREYAKAMRLHNQGKYGMLLQKYGTDNIKTIKRILYQKAKSTPRYQGLRFTAEGIRLHTALRARGELVQE